MRSPIALLRRRSLRLRITIAFVTAAVALAVVLSIGTMLTVRASLEDQRVRSSTRQTLFALLFAREFLASRPNPEALVSRLQIRQSFDAMVTRGEDWFATSLALGPGAVPAGLRALVSREGLGYEVTAYPGEGRVLVFGAPLPPERTDMYLFFPMQDIDGTLALVSRALALVGLAVVVASIVAARRVSIRILHPLASVSQATQRVAEGLLETRVQAASSDEVGQLAASFNRMAEALRVMIDRERAFVAAVSHELRTPLAALNASGEVLNAYEGHLPPDGREALGLIREDLMSLQQLVAELMEISALDAGRATVHTENVRMRPLVETLLRRRRRDAIVEGPDVPVRTDKARLERVLGNLIDNAFTHGEGRQVRIAIGIDDDRCSISVSDRGPGISAEDLPHLFERFYKPDRSRTRERGGVGLGLAIAAENARLLGGRIDVEPRKPGVSFIVRLPLDGTDA